MKVVCISDTHNHHDEIPVPDGDMLIHAGDFSIFGNEGEARAFATWFRNQPHKHKIVIPGNHDKFAVYSYSLLKEFLGPDVHYLDNQGIDIEGYIIWGSPWTPTFGQGWAFNADPGAEIQRHWSRIPDDVNILITHGPAYGILDWTYSWHEPHQKEHVGCYDLLMRLRELKALQMHVFGHIHEPHGVVPSFNDGVAVNAASTTIHRDRGYVFRNHPIVIDLGAIPKRRIFKP